MVYVSTRRGRGLGVFVALLSFGLSPSFASAQGLGGAGTVQGTVKDPTGGVMQSVEVKITNALSGFSRSATTDANDGDRPNDNNATNTPRPLPRRVLTYTTKHLLEPVGCGRPVRLKADATYDSFFEASLEEDGRRRA